MYELDWGPDYEYKVGFKLFQLNSVLWFCFSAALFTGGKMEQGLKKKKLVKVSKKVKSKKKLVKGY